MQDIFAKSFLSRTKKSSCIFLSFSYTERNSIFVLFLLPKTFFTLTGISKQMLFYTKSRVNLCIPTQISYNFFGLEYANLFCTGGVHSRIFLFGLVNLFLLRLLHLIPATFLHFGKDFMLNLVFFV